MNVADISAIRAKLDTALEMQPKAILLCALNIKPEPIHWLWPGWLAGGKLHVLAGPAGTGKTTIAINLAATVTTGDLWPDGSRCDHSGKVLIWSAEDGLADTLIPRLKAAGADLSEISFVTRTSEGERGLRSFDPATDIPLLAAACDKLTDVRLLIVDPIVSAIAGDSHKNAEVRRGLQPLVDLAERLGAAVLGITHFTKGTKGREPLERVTGSLAFGALARVVLGATKGEDDQRLLVRVKSNIGPDGGGFNYALEYPDLGGGVIGSRVVWGAAVDGDARTLLAESETDEDENDARNEREDAAEWLREVLADGPVSAKEIRRQADDAGHAWATVRRAKTSIGIVTEKAAFSGGWRWSLPKVLTKAEDAHTNCVSPLGVGEHLRSRPDLATTPLVAPKDAIESEQCQPKRVSPFDDCDPLRRETVIEGSL